MKSISTTLLVLCATGCLSEEMAGDAIQDHEGDHPPALSDNPSEEDTSIVSQESTAEGYVAGAGVVTDDFGDEGVIDTNDRNHSLAVGLWQMILWADEAIEADRTTFDLADVDCDFGPNTEAATISWQRVSAVRAPSFTVRRVMSA